MRVLNGLEARASQDPQPGNSTETGFPAIDPAILAKYAGQAGAKLAAMGASSKPSTSSKVLGATGEGLRDAGMGAGIGASIGSVIPGIGTVVGGAIGAIGGAIVGVIHFLFGGGSPKHPAYALPAFNRTLLKRGMEIYKTRHLPGAFQDAILCAYNPTAYQRLRAHGRLPSQIEAHLIQQRSYAAHAREIERHHGARLRRQLLHLPPDFRLLVGVGSITGHSTDLNVAMRAALANRARGINAPLLITTAVPPAPPAPLESPEPPEPGAPYNLAPGGQSQQGDPNIPDETRPALPVEGDAGDEAGAASVSTVFPGSGASPVFMRSVVDVVDAGDALFTWRPINVTFKRRPHDTSAQTLLGTFWVFVDALRDRVTGLRWPCSAAETQIVADKTLVAPGQLPQWWGPLGGEELPCLMMTTRLMCARWLNAKQAHEIIAPHPDSTADLLIAGCTRMNRAIDADLAQFPKPNPWVADPGKGWALHHRLFDGTALAVNYGWHVDPTLTAIPGPVSSKGAIPGVSLIQSAGGVHDEHDIDYSQLLWLVAPWCMVAPLGQDRMVPMRTADVYQSRELAGLVTDDALPLPSVRQPFDPNRVLAERQGFWAKQERMYEDKMRRGFGMLDVLPYADNGRGPARIEPPPVGSRAPRRSGEAPILTRALSPHDPFASLVGNRR